MPKILDQIEHANDIKNIRPQDYKKLAKEIRRFLVNNISQTGGHLASNLGVVELTMAMHVCLTFPEDKIVWDVGHQAYTHKLLTGRKEGFRSLRMYEGMSGFPKVSESDCDCFDTGHSSTSISAALGLVKARDLQGKDHKIVAVIGDGALSGGMAYEALNNAARLKSNMIIILNDNNMSISENVGGMSRYLGRIRTSNKYLDLKDDVQMALEKVPHVGRAIIDKLRRSKDSIKRLIIPGMLFEDMGITYLGPIDGHNTDQIINAIQNAKETNQAVLIHVITQKGKGYSLAEENPSKYHGVEPFDIKTGNATNPLAQETYTQVFSKKLTHMAKKDKRIVAITAAMPTGTGLLTFKDQYPSRFFDVGIAEEHAVTFAAGLAAGGMKPFVAIYSTFLQRAYDQIIHDVCLGNYPVVFAIDRAGIVGNDGETHQGVFDISFLNTIPNMTIIAPKNNVEFLRMLDYCRTFSSPIAIRYPRGTVCDKFTQFDAPIEYGKSEVLYEESDILLLALGSMVSLADEVRTTLKEKGQLVSLVNVRFAKPFDTDMLKRLADSHHTIVVLEENVLSGGLGQTVSHKLMELNQGSKRVILVNVEDTFIEHGEPEKLKEKLGMTVSNITAQILEG